MTTAKAVKNLLGRTKRKLLRSLGFSNLQKVLREVRRRGVSLGQLRALEVFAYVGEWHTMDYADLVSDLEAWEINPAYEESLKRNLPDAKIKITDSFAEIKVTPNRYGLIIVDNPMSIYHGHCGRSYCEHFELFPYVFRAAADSAVLILNVIPRVTQKSLKSYPYLFNEEQLRRRSAFYQTDHPEKLSIEEMATVYERYCRENDFVLEWYFSRQRSVVHYLVLKIRRAID